MRRSSFSTYFIPNISQSFQSIDSQYSWMLTFIRLVNVIVSNVCYILTMKNYCMLWTIIKNKKENRFGEILKNWMSSLWPCVFFFFLLLLYIFHKEFFYLIMYGKYINVASSLTLIQLYGVRSHFTNLKMMTDKIPRDRK